MGTVNRITILGTLGHDLDLRTTKTGKPFCRMSLATDSWKKSGNTETSTMWHSVHVFGKQAEAATRYLKKGRQVFIEGHLESSKSVDTEGHDSYKSWITADRVTFLNGGPRSDEHSVHGTDDNQRPADFIPDFDVPGDFMKS